MASVVLGDVLPGDVLPSSALPIAISCSAVLVLLGPLALLVRSWALLTFVTISLTFLVTSLTLLVPALTFHLCRHVLVAHDAQVESLSSAAEEKLGFSLFFFAEAFSFVDNTTLPCPLVVSFAD